MDTLELPLTEPESAADQSARPTRSAAVMSPRDRPPFASRLFIGVIGFGAMLSTAALLLSDRAPGALRAVFGDRVRQLWERIDSSERVDLPPSSELPATDFLVHVAIWVVVAALVGLAVWSWRRLAVAVAVLAATSVVLELAQGRYADTRVVETRDAVANVLGIGLGALVAACCYLVWSALAAATRRFRID